MSFLKSGRGHRSWADEEGTLQALREHRAVADPLIAEHGGRIVKTTGDGC
jgi:adenylate cyclase